jgi:hypothetical protein
VSKFIDRILEVKDGGIISLALAHNEVKMANCFYWWDGFPQYPVCIPIIPSLLSKSPTID